MTSKEAFEILKRYEAELSITKQTEVSYDDVISARYEISKLVERDTPKKPIVNIDNEIKEYNCGVCVCRLDIPQNFCPKCGQRIDWSKL
jgi:rubrerythrin